MKIKIKNRHFGGALFILLSGLMSLCFLFSRPANAVTDTDPVLEQRWVISEVYLGGDDYKGAYVELYNNDDHNSLGWKDFVLNLPFDLDIPPVYNFHTYKPHATKAIPLDEGWMGWVVKQYMNIVYGDQFFDEIHNALKENTNYAYQRCLTVDDGDDLDNAKISQQFYYGKKSKGKQIYCSDSSLTSTKPEDQPKAGECKNLRLNEIYTNDIAEEQFVEIVNSGLTDVDLSKCGISKNTSSGKSEPVALGEGLLAPQAIYTFHADGTGISPLAKTSGVIYLVDSDKTTAIDYKRYSTKKSLTALALNDDGHWKVTYKPTADEDNIIQQCPDGQAYNSTAGKCRQEKDDNKSDSKDDSKDSSKDNSKSSSKNTKPNKSANDEDSNSDASSSSSKSSSKSALMPCKDGYERNPGTNRCRKIESTSTDSEYQEEDDKESSSSSTSSSLEPCKDGYERNPVTNRCRKISSKSTSSSSSSSYSSTKSTLKACRAGYVRNPLTNRCIKSTTASGSKKLKACKDGYVRNPATNRCIKKNKTKKQLKPCKDGYTRNPKTNRCIKKTTASGSTSAKSGKAKYPVTEVNDAGAEHASDISLIVVLVIITSIAAGILLWQYRVEIKRFIDKHKKDKNDKKETKNLLTEDPPKEGETDEWLDKLTKQD